jgi:hypothetical protein
MDTTRRKSLALVIGVAAIMVAITLCLIHSGTATSSGNLAGGSGDSPTGTTYTQPSLPAMSVDPTNMKMGSTVTESAPPTTIATMEASPVVKATAAPGCVNNGQCP